MSAEASRPRLLEAQAMVKARRDARDGAVARRRRRRRAPLRAALTGVGGGLLAATLALRWEDDRAWVWDSAPWRAALVVAAVVAAALAVARPGWVGRRLAAVVTAVTAVASVAPLGRWIESIDGGEAAVVVPAMGAAVAVAGALAVLAGSLRAAGEHPVPSTRQGWALGAGLGAVTVAVSAVAILAPPSSDVPIDPLGRDELGVGASLGIDAGSVASARIAWSRPTGSVVVSPGGLGAGIAVLTGYERIDEASRWRAIEVVSAAGGTPAWTFDVGLPRVIEAAWSGRGLAALLAAEDSTPTEVVLVDGGDERWRVPLGRDAQAVLGVDDAVLTVGTRFAVAVDAATGAQRWATGLAEDASCERAEGRISGTVLVVGRTCGGTLRLDAIDLTTGAARWDRSVFGGALDDGRANEFTSPTLLDGAPGGTLLVSSAALDGTELPGIAGLGVDDGALRWRDADARTDGLGGGAYLADGADGLWRIGRRTVVEPGGTVLPHLDRIDPATGEVLVEAVLSPEQRADLRQRVTLRRAGDRVVVSGEHGVGQPPSPASQRRFGGLTLDATTGVALAPVEFGAVDTYRDTVIVAADADVALFDVRAPGYESPEADTIVDVWLVAVPLR